MFFIVILTIVLCIIYAIMLIHHELWYNDINLICKIKGHDIVEEDDVNYLPHPQSSSKLKVILHTCKCERCNKILQQTMTYSIVKV